jgi:pimeloyl-ACP methyl ester carboxylesterase
MGPDGARLAYEVRAERPGAPAVLALHGVLVGASNWIHQVLRLPVFSWIVPHLRGHGQSPPPMPRQTIEAAALDALAVLDEQGVQRCVVLGNSLGATVGLALALLRSDRVRAMVLVEPSLPALLGERGRQRLQQSAVETRALLTAGRIDDALALFLVPRLGEDWERKAGRRRIDEWRRNIFSVPAWIDAVLAFDPGPVPLAVLDQPSLLVYGAETQPFYREMTQALAELLPGTELVEIAGAGHGVPADNPEAFNALLVSFLDRLGIR